MFTWFCLFVFVLQRVTYHVTLEPRSPLLTWEARWSWIPRAAIRSHGPGSPVRTSFTLRSLGPDVPLSSRSSRSPRFSYYSGQSLKYKASQWKLPNHALIRVNTRQQQSRNLSSLRFHVSNIYSPDHYFVSETKPSPDPSGVVIVVLVAPLPFFYWISLLLITEVHPRKVSFPKRNISWI